MAFIFIRVSKVTRKETGLIPPKNPLRRSAYGEQKWREKNLPLCCNCGFVVCAQFCILVSPVAKVVRRQSVVQKMVEAMAVGPSGSQIWNCLCISAERDFDKHVCEGVLVSEIDFYVYGNVVHDEFLCADFRATSFSPRRQKLNKSELRFHKFYGFLFLHRSLT
jgi:hypothetical protein